MMIRARAWAARIHSSKSYIKICRSDVAFAVSVKLSPQMPRPNAHSHTHTHTHGQGVDKWSAISLQMTTDLLLISLFNLLLLLGGKLCAAKRFIYICLFRLAPPHIHDHEPCCCCCRARVRMTHGTHQKNCTDCRRVWGLFDYAVVIRKQCAQTQAANSKASMPWQKRRHEKKTVRPSTARRLWVRLYTNYHTLAARRTNKSMEIMRAFNLILFYSRARIQSVRANPGA